VVEGDLNCFFCYCPLYDEVKCGGDYVILDNGLKDCSDCLKPRMKEFIEEQLLKII
jgi:Zn-finger protein